MWYIQLSILTLSDHTVPQSDERPSKKAKVGNGKAQATNAKIASRDPWKLLSDAKKDWTQMQCPPLHMF